MYRSIWLYYFVSGALGLGAGLPAIDVWVAGVLPSATTQACLMADPLAGISRADITLCLASWLLQGRDLAFHGIDILTGAHVGMRMRLDPCHRALHALQRSRAQGRQSVCECVWCVCEK